MKGGVGEIENTTSSKVTRLVENCTQTTIGSDQISLSGSDGEIKISVVGEIKKSTSSIVLQSLVTIIGLLANIITLISLTLNGQEFPRITRILLLHQTTIDSFVCATGIVMCIQPFMWMTGAATFDLLLCQLWHGQAIYWFGVLISIWNLVFIAVERYVMIRFTYNHQNIKRKHIYSTFFAMYVLCLIVKIPASL